MPRGESSRPESEHQAPDWKDKILHSYGRTAGAALLGLMVSLPEITQGQEYMEKWFVEIKEKIAALVEKAGATERKIEEKIPKGEYQELGDGKFRIGINIDEEQYGESFDLTERDPKTGTEDWYIDKGPNKGDLDSMIRTTHKPNGEIEVQRFDITWKKDGPEVRDTYLSSNVKDRPDNRGIGFPQDVDLGSAAALQGAFSTKLEEAFSQIKRSKNK